MFVDVKLCELLGPLKALGATTWTETSSVRAQKFRGYVGNQQPSPFRYYDVIFMGTVQRLSREGVGLKGA